MFAISVIIFGVRNFDRNIDSSGPLQNNKGDKLQVDQRIHEQWMSGDRDQLALALTTALKCNCFSIDKKTMDRVHRFNRKMFSKLIISSENFQSKSVVLIFLLPNFLLKIPSFPFEKTQPNHQQFLRLQVFYHTSNHITVTQTDATKVFSPRFH